MVTPATRRWPWTRSATSARPVAVVVARSKAAAQDALELDRGRLRAAAGRARHGGGARRAAPTGATTTLAPTRPTRGSSTPARPAPAGHRRGRRGRRGRREPPVRPAAADPGVHGAAVHRRPAAGRRVHDVVGHPDPAHPAVHAGADHRHPRAQDPGHRARRRRRLRRQAAGHARGVDHAPGGQAARQAGQVDRDPQRVADERPPRPRPDPGHRRSPPTATATSPA